MKKISAFLLILVCFISLCACNFEGISDDSNNLNDIFEEYIINTASSKLDIEKLKLDTNEDYQDFIKKIQLFSAKLSVSIFNSTEDKTQNLCISPVSVYMALAMTITSANGPAKEELLNALDVTEDEVNNFTKYLYSYLKQERYKYNDQEELQLSSILDINNSIWVDENIELKQTGLDNLANNFMTDSFYVPFMNENQKANELISKYIEKKTRGLIKPKLELEPDTMFTLLNTLYMKDFWRDCHDKLNFSKNKHEFIASNGEIIKKSFLESRYNLGRVYETNEYKHFYVKTDSGYNLKLFIPKDGYSLEDIFTVNNLVEINDIKNYNHSEIVENEEYGPQTIEHNTRVIFPTFEASYNNDLISIFVKDFGVKKIFTPGENLKGLTDLSETYISGIIHQTKLKVDETGIEGAAITMMIVEGEDAGPIIKLHEFLIDRAFGYLLTDVQGNIIFSGVVNTI